MMELLGFLGLIWFCLVVPFNVIRAVWDEKSSRVQKSPVRDYDNEPKNDSKVQQSPLNNEAITVDEETTKEKSWGDNLMSEKYSKFVSGTNSKIAAREAEKAESDKKTALVEQRSRLIFEKLEPHFKTLSTELFQKIDEPFDLGHSFTSSVNEYTYTLNGNSEIKNNVRFRFFEFSLKRPTEEVTDHYYFEIRSGFPLNKYHLQSATLSFGVYGLSDFRGKWIDLCEREKTPVTKDRFEQIMDDYKNGIFPEFDARIPFVVRAVDMFVLGVLQFYRDFENDDFNISNTESWKLQYKKMYDALPGR